MNTSSRPPFILFIFIEQILRIEAAIPSGKKNGSQQPWGMASTACSTEKWVANMLLFESSKQFVHSDQQLRLTATACILHFSNILLGGIFNYCFETCTDCQFELKKTNKTKERETWLKYWIDCYFLKYFYWILFFYLISNHLI